MKGKQHRAISKMGVRSWDGIYSVVYVRCTCGETIRDDPYLTVYGLHQEGNRQREAEMTLQRLQREIDAVAARITGMAGCDCAEQLRRWAERLECAVQEQADYTLRYADIETQPYADMPRVSLPVMERMMA